MPRTPRSPIARAAAAATLATALAVPLAASVPPAAAAGPVSIACASDPTGDVAHLDDAGNRTGAVDDQRADVSALCVDYSATSTINFSIYVGAPTEPTTDPAWKGITGPFWNADTNGDAQTDFAIGLYDDGNGPEVVVSQYSRTASGGFAGITERCRTPQRAARTQAGYSTGPVAASCLDSPSTVAVTANMSYDTDGSVTTGGYDYDDVPNAGGFAGAALVTKGGGRGRPVGRVAGTSRIGTSIEISKTGFPRGSTEVFLARQDGLADAVAAGALTTGPVLLTPSCSLPAEVKAEIDRLKPARVFALGGTGAVCDAVLRAAATGRQSGRLAGASRYDTAVAISAHAFGGAAATVYLANGVNVADAVAGGALTDGPVLLLPGCSVPTPVASEISRLKPQRVVALGGTGAVCDSALSQAAGGRTTGRLAGTDRYATAVAISAAAFPEAASTAYLAEAGTFADAVAAGTLTGGPVLLVPSNGDVPAAVLNEVSRLGPGAVTALGGYRAVSDAVLRQAANA